jgi:hypothetical protein
MLPQPSTRLWLSTRATQCAFNQVTIHFRAPLCGTGRDPSRIVLCTVQCTCQCQARRGISADSDSRRRGASGLASAAFSAQDAEAALGSPDLARAGTPGSGRIVARFKNGETPVRDPGGGPGPSCLVSLIVLSGPWPSNAPGPARPATGGCCIAAPLEHRARSGERRPGRAASAADPEIGTCAMDLHQS